jgi:hypothetical protein
MMLAVAFFPKWEQTAPSASIDAHDAMADNARVVTQNSETENG